MVHQDLTTGFPLFDMLGHWNGGLAWKPIGLDRPFAVDACPALRFTPIPLRSAAPPYSPHRNDPHPGDNLGLLFYAPGLGQVDVPLLDWMGRADCLLVDGTLWRDDELIHAGVGTRLGSEMGHLPQSGAGGMLEVLDGLAGRKVLIHCWRLLAMLLQAPFYQALWVEQGLGYALFSRFVDTEAGAELQFGVQSPQASVARLQQAIRDFLVAQPLRLQRAATAWLGNRPDDWPPRLRAELERLPAADLHRAAQALAGPDIGWQWLLSC